MISEFIEVILKIYDALNKNSNPEKVLESISRQNHYHNKVLAAAYSWICDKVLKDVLSRKSIDKKETSMRIVSENELKLIGLDNFNYILHFYNLGIMNGADLELIMDQLVLFPEGTVTKEKIDVLIFSLFLDLDNFVLPGSRVMLFSSDKIN